MNQSIIHTMLALSLVLMVPVSTWAKNSAAFAQFVDETNDCISTEVFVKMRTSGNSNNAKITLSIYSMDMCNEKKVVWVRMDNGVLKNGTALFNEQTSTARISGTVTVFDHVTKQKHNVELNLQWQGNGEQLMASDVRDITETPSDNDKMVMAAKHYAVYQDATAHGSIDFDANHLKFTASRDASLSTTVLK